VGRVRRALLGLAGAAGAVLVLVIAFAVMAGAIRLFSSPGRDATGQVTRGGEDDPWELKAGDCFDPEYTGTAGISRVIVVPCTESHHYEVVFADKLTGSDYPTEADLHAWVRSSCAPAYLPYIGKSIDDTDLAVYYFSPDATAWRNGIRSAQCSVTDPNNNPMTISVRGSRR
jgi:hypothetical protein